MAGTLRVSVMVCPVYRPDRHPSQRFPARIVSGSAISGGCVMKAAHHYAVRLSWTGNRGTGTSGYREYGREHTIIAAGKHPIDGSADRTFHGNADRWNPEELLLTALSQCHMLSYLHVAARNGVTVTAYTDAPVGTMKQLAGGGGHFTSATLRPYVSITDPDQVEFA